MFSGSLLPSPQARFTGFRVAPRRRAPVSVLLARLARRDNLLVFHAARVHTLFEAFDPSYLAAPPLRSVL
jgi:hypothetical protein